jgi:hypothetical protein
MADSIDVIRRRVRQQIQQMKSFGMDPDDCTFVDPLTGKPPATWERVEEVLVEIRLKQRRPTE